nr:orotidine-5'-phosphate decarboxylase [Lautropia mirabilis]
MNTTPSFTHTLRQRWQAADSMLCVGLDPDPARIPAHLGTGPEAIDRFCRDIIAATADTVCAFKPQIAYFAAQGAEDVLAGLIAHIHAEYPGIPVILDAKRGDIGSTARQYGVEAFDRFKADALTLSPFMGFDSIEPYFEWAGRGLILLCRTSNPGGNDLQALSVLPAGDTAGAPPALHKPASGTPPDTQPEKLYEHLARLAAGPWNVNGELGLVVGATFPDELARVRTLAPRLPLLVPGVGAQGGDVNATVRAGLDADGYGLVINSSRAILYAGKGTDFADQARKAAVATRDAIRAARDAARA